MNKLLRFFKHRWMDRSDTVRAVPDDMAERIGRRVSASEGRHTGEVRLCVEASLPLSYLWRIGPELSLSQAVRERAITWFGRLRIWDTEHNNGVLIYVLLAEHAIEFVADRAVCQRVSDAEWQAIVDRLGNRLRSGEFEDGLTQALEEVTALLVHHFPAESGSRRSNELPDAVVRP